MSETTMSSIDFKNFVQGLAHAFRGKTVSKVVFTDEEVYFIVRNDENSEWKVTKDELIGIGRDLISAQTNSLIDSIRVDLETLKNVYQRNDFFKKANYTQDLLYWLEELEEVDTVKSIAETETKNGGIVDKKKRVKTQVFLTDEELLQQLLTYQWMQSSTNIHPEYSRKTKKFLDTYFESTALTCKANECTPVKTPSKKFIKKWIQDNKK